MALGSGKDTGREERKVNMESEIKVKAKESGKARHQWTSVYGTTRYQ